MKLKRLGNLIIFLCFFTFALTVNTSAQAAGTVTPLFRCIDEKDGYKLSIDAISRNRGKEYLYQMKVLNIDGDLIYISNAELSPIGRETIFAIYGKAEDQNGRNTTSSLYFRVDKIESKVSYILDEQSYAPIRLPWRIHFSCL